MEKNKAGEDLQAGQESPESSQRGNESDKSAPKKTTGCFLVTR